MSVKIGRTVYVTATEAATMLRWKRDTFTSKVSRGNAPQPAIGGEPGVQKLYKESDIIAYRDNRPGQGARTDLKGKR